MRHRGDPISPTARVTGPDRRALPRHEPYTPHRLRNQRRRLSLTPQKGLYRKAEGAGVEPARACGLPGLAARCRRLLSACPSKAPGEIRTPDIAGSKPAALPLSYEGKSPGGVEPPRPGLGNRRSSAELRGHVLSGWGGDRTHKGLRLSCFRNRCRRRPSACPSVCRYARLRRAADVLDELLRTMPYDCTENRQTPQAPPTQRSSVSSNTTPSCFSAYAYDVASSGCPPRAPSG